MATYYRRDDYVISGIGQAVPGVTVSYFSQPSLTPATVYTSSTGGGTGGNTNITDGFGHAVAYMAAGTYTIAFSGSNIQSYTLPDQMVGPTSSSAAEFSQIPTGTINGTNVTFTLTVSPSLLFLTLNGQTLTPGVGYTLAGNIITMTTAPLTGAILYAQGLV